MSKTFEARLQLLFGLVALVVDQHDVAADPHLVRVQTLGNFQVGDDFRILRILDVDDRSAVRRIHVTDVGVTVFDDDGAAAG